MTSNLKQPRSSQIPISAVKTLSDTNKAYDCFVGQKFSANLQTYLLAYVDYVASYYAVPVNAS